MVEQKDIKHYFIDSHSIHDELTAAQYAQEALELLDKLFKTHDQIILVGGSGMFIDALCNGLDDIPASKELRDKLNSELIENGLEALLTELKEKDPEYYNQVDKQNPARVIRALEAIRLSGLPYSTMRKATQKKHPFEIKRFVINHPREQLYDRINRRVDNMMAQGLLEEVKKVKDFRHLSSLRTVGYSELFDYLDNKTDLPTAVELIKQNTRRYAKRQLTWFRRDPSVVWIPFNSVENMKEDILISIKNS
jgi:tRNA dimethylallyltransferase